jgi:ribonuclease HI
LMQLRKDYTHWRNRARAIRRSGQIDQGLEAMARAYKKRFHDTMRQQRKTHWQEFVAESKNIWSISRYMDPTKTTAFANIPTLRTGGDSDEDIATTLLEEFFKPLPEVERQTEDSRNEPTLDELPMDAVTEAEVQRAVFAASPHKTPGIDDIPAFLWQQTWPILKHHIVTLFQLSIQSSSLPQAWKIAKIIPLRKPGKPDYTAPKAYRPISLLATLGKCLESLVAERISYLAETHNLLPKNHFGARKGRSTTQALTAIQEYVYQAWRERKVLSMVSFDLKGAYNGVDIESLAQRLRKRRIPEPLVKWTHNFCRQRSASVMINGHTTTVTELAQAGLPQGSPLSPILFLFFNADLVSSKLNRNEGAVAFVDDYTAWVTGPTAERNTEVLQETVIPKAANWARSSGATFEADKTAFIHFTRNRKKLSETTLSMDGQEIQPQTEIKVLGVVLDQGLRFKHHIARAAKRGTNAALALRRIKGMTSKTTRQLFTAMVAPVTDYASPVWSPVLTISTTRMLNQAQRIGAQAIVGAFRTVALERAEMEASITPVYLRLQHQQNTFWIKSHTLPAKHPFWKIQRAVDTRNKRFRSPLQRMAERLKTIDLSDLEKIESFCIPPWQQKISATVLSREDALTWTEAPTETRIFVDASYRQGNAGAGIFVPTDNNTTGTQDSYRIGHCEGWTATHVETMAIERAFMGIAHTWPPQAVEQHEASIRSLTYVIVSDSQTAIRHIANPQRQSGQKVVQNIYNMMKDILDRGFPKIRMQWAPAHAKLIGNEIADQMAKQATKDNLPEIRGLTVPVVLRKAKEVLVSNRNHSRHKHTDDAALPGKHTKTLYDNLLYREAAVLCQLRTGKNRLHYYLAKIGAVETDQCECIGNPIETMRHFLFECPRWHEHRRRLMEVAGDRWGDPSFFLGGRVERLAATGKPMDGPRNTWKPEKKVVDRTIEFAIATGRLS